MSDVEDAARAFPVACVIVALEDPAAPSDDDAGGDAPCWAGMVDQADRLRRVIDAAVNVGASPIVAASPPGMAVPSPARSVPGARAGGDAALRLALSQLASSPAVGALVWPVDEGEAEVESALVVLDAAKRTGAPVVVPLMRGKRGWPVFFARDTWRELVTTPGGARAVLRLYETRLHRVAADAGAGTPSPRSLEV